jgi:hypothetical protein
MKYSLSAFAFGLFLSVGAHGGTIVSVQSVTAAAGGPGAIDVSLTNTGSSTIMVGAFTFGISTTNPAISFTDANTLTVLDGQSILVSDVFATPLTGAAVASGATVDLGHVLFTVASDSAIGVFTTSLLATPATSLSDTSGAHIVIDTLSNGTVTVGGVPEPSSLLLLLSGVALICVRHSAFIVGATLR